MISRSEAKEKISNILNTQQPIKIGQKLPIRPTETFNVYRIPLDLLVPNVLNDRITWRIREFEAENSRKLDVDSDTDVDFLYSLILDEHKQDNARTEEDLAQKGQMVDGVISANGIIIDGNRRATLLRDLFNGKAAKYNKSVEDFRYFNAIVLPGDISPEEIMALETMIQVGSDKPVDYNRICLYIKVDNLLNAGYNYTQIRQYMRLKTDKDVEEMATIYKLMVEYLEAIDKPNHFTLLDGLEDQFINTKNVFKRLDNKTYDAKWDYTPEDVAEFKMVCYDYMRSKFEGKKFRDVLVGKPNRSNGVFIEKKVWKDFLENHNAIIDEANPASESDWQLLGKKEGKFEQNLNKAVKELADTLNDRNLSSLIKEIRQKITKIDDLVSGMSTIDSKDAADLSLLSDELSKVISKVK